MAVRAYEFYQFECLSGPVGHLSADRKRFSRLFMRVRGARAGQSTSATDRNMTLQNLSPKCILLVALLLLLDCSVARPQQFFLADDLVTETGTGPATAAATGFGDDRLPINDPSDLSAGLNLAPVGSLISAAANAVPPAPIQFIRMAMNSGL